MSQTIKVGAIYSQIRFGSPVFYMVTKVTPKTAVCVRIAHRAHMSATAPGQYSAEPLMPAKPINDAWTCDPELRLRRCISEYSGEEYLGNYKTGYHLNRWSGRPLQYYGFH